MPRYTLTCQQCGRLYIATRRNQKFCSSACRVAHARAVSAKRYKGLSLGPGGPEEPSERVVGEDEIAHAVVDVRAAAATFSAAELTGPPAMRPCCGRLKVGILAALEAEGL